MKVNTTRFGTLEIDESTLLTMPRGPLGFEEQTRFCLIQHRPGAPFRWLQSTEDPGLAFPVMDPSEFFSNYAFEISDADAETASAGPVGRCPGACRCDRGDGMARKSRPTWRRR